MGQIFDVKFYQKMIFNIHKDFDVTRKVQQTFYFCFVSISEKKFLSDMYIAWPPGI